MWHAQNREKGHEKFYTKGSCFQSSQPCHMCSTLEPHMLDAITEVEAGAFKKMTESLSCCWRPHTPSHLSSRQCRVDQHTTPHHTANPRETLVCCCFGWWQHVLSPLWFSHTFFKALWWMDASYEAGWLSVKTCKHSSQPSQELSKHIALIALLIAMRICLSLHTIWLIDKHPWWNWCQTHNKQWSLSSCQDIIAVILHGQVFLVLPSPHLPQAIHHQKGTRRVEIRLRRCSYQWYRNIATATGQ